VLVAEHADRWVFAEAIYRHQSGDQPIADKFVSVPVGNISWWSEK
jgi:hypothetical protein